MMQKTLSREAIALVVAFVSFAVGAVETPPQIFKPGRGSPKLRTSLRAVMPAIPDAKWTKGWWMPRHEQKLAEIRKIGNPKVVFLGDSITHFWEDSGRGLRTWNKYFTNETYRAVNLGFSGDRTEHVLWRIAHGELDGYQAKAVVLMLGTNNTGHFPVEKEPPEATILGMQAVVRAIRAKQPQAKLVICAIFPCDEKADGQRRLRNEIVNKEIQKLADGRNVFWLDFTTSFLTADGELLGEIMPDRLHPAAHGYEIWANAVLPYLNHALTAKDGEELLFPSTFAPRVKSEVTGAHTMPARPMATFGMRWWGEFADRPLETMKKIADNPVVQVDEKGVTNRWFDVVMVGRRLHHAPVGAQRLRRRGDVGALDEPLCRPQPRLRRRFDRALPLAHEVRRALRLQGEALHRDDRHEQQRRPGNVPRHRGGRADDPRDPSRVEGRRPGHLPAERDSGRSDAPEVRRDLGGGAEASRRQGSERHLPRPEREVPRTGRHAHEGDVPRSVASGGEGLSRLV